MKNTTTIAIIIAGILITGAIYFTNQKDNEVYIYSDDSQTEIRVEFKKGFMDGCYDGTNKKECECFYSEIEKEYGFSGFVDMAITYSQDNEIPERANEAILNCL